METFKRQYKKSFTLTHCYRALKDQQKWKALYASLKNGGQPLDKGEDTTEKEERPRGKNNSKAELKRDATTVALQETLNGFLTQKDKAADKKEERREKERLEREASSKLFIRSEERRVGKEC